MTLADYGLLEEALVLMAQRRQVNLAAPLPWEAGGALEKALLPSGTGAT